MSRIKQKLANLLKEDSRYGEKAKLHRNFRENTELRQKIKETFKLPLASFCKQKPTFDYRHGLVYKLLKTSQLRLKDSTLASHDMSFWLHNYKNPVPALWVLRLAGPESGAVARNQFLQWIKTNRSISDMELIYKWTKKWGFQDTEYTSSIIDTQPYSVSQARERYRDTKFKSTKSKQVFGNNLLQQVASSGNAEEVWAFFRSLNKDIITIQIMLAAMIVNNALRTHCEDVWQLAKRQEQSNNIVIDEKLQQTYERVRSLPLNPTIPAKSQETPSTNE